MTHDDETVERVARAIYEAIIVGEEVHHDAFDDIPEPYRRQLLVEARAALSAMPSAALLREALEALDRQRVWHEGHDKALSKQPPNTDVRWRRLEHQEQAEDARAAADKIRAALEHQQKGERL